MNTLSDIAQQLLDATGESGTPDRQCAYRKYLLDAKSRPLSEEFQSPDFDKGLTMKINGYNWFLFIFQSLVEFLEVLKASVYFILLFMLCSCWFELCYHLLSTLDVLLAWIIC